MLRRSGHIRDTPLSRLTLFRRGQAVAAAWSAFGRHVRVRTLTVDMTEGEEELVERASGPEGEDEEDRLRSMR